MSNKNFTLTYDELLLLLKDAYRNGYSTYEMADAGLERYDDDGYARWVLLGMESNKQRKEIIKKWEESGLLDGLTEMDKDHPMLKVLEANGKQGINEQPISDIKDILEVGVGGVVTSREGNLITGFNLREVSMRPK